jgi:hypothetical protein
MWGAPMILKVLCQVLRGLRDTNLREGTTPGSLP